jgi:hypothetical protein
MYRQELKGEIREGERLFTRITQSVKGEDPQTSRAVEGRLESLRPWDDPEPPAVLATPGDRRGHRAN